MMDSAGEEATAWDLISARYAAALARTDSINAAGARRGSLGGSGKAGLLVSTVSERYE